MYVTELTAPEVVAVARRAFPNYTGRKFQIGLFKGPMRLDSYWGGGSKDYFKVVSIVPGGANTFTVPENGGHPLQNDGKICELSELPPGLALVNHHLFCGRDMGITVFVSAENMNRLALPPAVELDNDEKICLGLTCSLKAFARRDEAKSLGMNAALWDATVKRLQARGYLNKAGAVTPEGRNAGNTFDRLNLRDLKAGGQAAGQNDGQGVEPAAGGQNDGPADPGGQAAGQGVEPAAGGQNDGPADPGGQAAGQACFNFAMKG